MTQFNMEANSIRPKNILLTTSAATDQSPFSTSEKRMPIGVGYLISVLREAGHEVFFIDNYLQPSDFLETDYLQRNEIDYVGIYSNTICFRDTLRMVNSMQRLRETGQWKGKIMVGGPHTTVAADTIPDFVDYVVQGEGERAIVDIVNGKVNERLVRYPQIENLDELPRPAWDVFTKLPYNMTMEWFGEGSVFNMNTSRSCPFNCSFCSVGSIWGKKYTSFSAERVVDDIQYLIENYGAKGIYFREDNFTLNKKRLMRFCELMIERNINIPWACESRVSTVDDESCELMARAGLIGFYFGVESGSQRILDQLQKDITVDQTREAFRICHKYNIKAAASVIVGIPGETGDDISLTNELLNEIKPATVWPNVFVGIPDSKLYRNVLETRQYEFIDDRGLVYLQGHNERAVAFYGAGFASKAAIPMGQDLLDMKDRPKISVLMSVYNGEKYIAEALQSIYTQTFQDFEVVIVDDASTDSTPDILQRMKDSRTVIYRNATNKGLCKSLNTGLNFCRGDYIARMDADDISMPQRFEKQVVALDSDHKCAAVGSWVQWIDENGTKGNIWQPATSPEQIHQRLLVKNTIAHGSAMIRKSSLFEIDGYDESYKHAQDYDLWLRLSEIAHLRNIDEPLYHLRSWNGSISVVKKEMQDQFAQEALNAACKRRGLSTCEQIVATSSLSKTKLSVVITTYNRAELLDDVLDGFVKQTASKDDFEVVVVDDGSDVSVESIINKYAPAINIVFHRQANSGLAAARNKGVEMSHGEIVLFSDDDDVPSSDLVAEHLRSHAENPDEKIAVLGHLQWHSDLNVSHLMHYVTGPGGEYFGFDQMQDGQFYDTWKWWGGLISAKRSLLTSVEGPFDERLRFGYEDTELVCRLLDKNVRIVYNAKAKSYIVRDIDFDDFCDRRYKQGRALYNVAVKHSEIIVPRYGLQDAEAVYTQKLGQLDEWTGQVPDVESQLAKDGGRNRELMQTLYDLYRVCFMGHWLRGYLDQKRDVEQGVVSIDQAVNAQVQTQSPSETIDYNSIDDLACGPKRSITMISSCTPGYDVGSSNQRIANLLKILADSGHDIDYLYYSSYPKDDEYMAPFAGRVNFIKLAPEARSFTDYFERNVNKDIDCVWVTNLWSVESLEFTKYLIEWMKQHRSETKVIVDTMDFHCKKWARRYGASGDQRAKAMAEQFLEIERQLYPIAEETVVVTEDEKTDILQEVGLNCNITVVPNIHKIATKTPSCGQRQNICFLGSFNTTHNIDAVNWFLKNVFPLILKEQPDVEFHIMGYDNDKHRAVYEAYPNVKMIGYVEDADAAVANYKVFACPMTYGAGMKGKLGNAAANGTPIVTTQIGAEGFGFENGTHCLITDNPSEFANSCLAILRDDNVWEHLSRNAKELLASKYSIKAVSRMMPELLEYQSIPESNSHLVPNESGKIEINDTKILEILDGAVFLFGESQLDDCVKLLENAEVISPGLSKRFKNFNLLKAMAYVELGQKQMALQLLTEEMKVHGNAAAGQFMADYLTSGINGTAQEWCIKNSNVYELEMIDTDKKSVYAG